MSEDKIQSSYTANPPSIPGKPILESLPTPNLDDRILVIRKDLRRFKKLPAKGSRYTGPNADDFKDFRFATAKPSDQIGWANFYYINERKNQDEYNFEISYPYTSKDYPTVTRTYVFLRGDQRGQEPDADSKDPVYYDLSLTDHKVIRLQQPELDALFVGIQRVYEALPSPVITSFEMNQPQQEVTVQEHEDIAPNFPTVDALTEVAKVERKTTAKAKVTLATVPEVFPDTNYTTSRDDAVVPYRHRKFLGALPSVQTSQIQAGTATVPVLADIDWTASDHQITKYKHQFSRTVRNLTAPIALLEYRLTPEQQFSTIVETWAPGLQTFTPAPLTIEADVIQLGNNESIKNETTIPSVFPQSIYEIEIPDPVPQKFRVTIPVTATTQTSIGTAAPPVLGTGELSKRDEQTKVFWHRLYTRGRDVSQLPISLVSYELTPEQQVGAVTETLATGLQTLSPDALLIKASVDNLGNNTSLKSTTVVPDVFNKAEYRITIPDIIPEKFRVAVPITESALTTAGTALPPVLGTGDLERIEQQEKEFWHRTTIRGRAGVVLPVFLISYKMTREKQIETVTETLNTGLQSITPTALTIEADVTNLGNNTSLKTVGLVPTLFTKPRYEKSIPDLVPPEFRATVPTLITELSSVGTASPPTLGTGDISNSVEQMDEFVIRTRLETRSGIALPQQFINKELTREFGGAQTNVIRTLNLAGTQTLDEGLLVLKSEIKNLGNGMELKETQQNNGIAWPPLNSSLWDENMRIPYFESKEVVPAGFAPQPDPGGDVFAWLSEVKPIDKWRSIIINTVKLTPPYISPDTALITRDFKPYRFPGYLQNSGYGYYTRAAEAVLVEHVIRTWWEKSTTTPTIAYDRIVTGDVIINNLANTGLEYARNVLHDGFSFGVIAFPPTTPTATEYAVGTQNGTARINIITAVSTAGGYFVGEVLGLAEDGGSWFGHVASVAPGGYIQGVTPASGIFGWPLGNFNYVVGNIYWTVSSFDYPVYQPGSAWIGTYRIIEASVIPEKEPNIWKCQTKSIIMQ